MYRYGRANWGNRKYESHGSDLRVDLGGGLSGRGWCRCGFGPHSYWHWHHRYGGYERPEAYDIQKELCFLKEEKSRWERRIEDLERQLGQGGQL